MKLANKFIFLVSLMLMGLNSAHASPVPEIDAGSAFLGLGLMAGLLGLLSEYRRK
ncbi:hypothetical protein JCM14076_28320 [Methylosoma difficile]